MDLEGKRTFDSQYIKDEEGRLLQGNALIREHWVRWFNNLLSTESPTVDQTIVGQLKTWPPCKLLDHDPSRHEVQEVIRAMAIRKAVGPDDLPIELLKVLTDEGDPRKVPREHCRCVEGRWRAVAMKLSNNRAAAKKERRAGVWQLSWHDPCSSHR